MKACSPEFQFPTAAHHLIKETDTSTPIYLFIDIEIMYNKSHIFKVYNLMNLDMDIPLKPSSQSR
jgi:hypothetical protein